MWEDNWHAGVSAVRGVVQCLAICRKLKDVISQRHAEVLVATTIRQASPARDRSHQRSRTGQELRCSLGISIALF